MEKALLQKAQEVRMKRQGRGHSYTDEQIELAFAWLKGEVRAKQICVALGKKTRTSSYLYFMASVLKRAYERGKLKIV